jgi:hypothetical protein
MAAVLAPLVSIAGFAAYFLATFKLALYRRYPWEFLAVIAAGAVLGAVAFVRAPSAGRAAGALASAGVLGFACWFLFAFSMYGRREDRPRVRERFPDFTLPASDGGSFRLAAERRPRLLVLYRGAW